MSLAIIVGLGGTLRERLYSRMTLHEVVRVTTEHGAQTGLLDLRELNLPMFVPGYHIKDYPLAHHASIARLIKGCRRATAMMWASPTYDGNALKHTQRPLLCV